MNRLHLIAAAFAMLGLAACGSLEKELDLELPIYQPQYVVESYLEPGQPFSLLLTRSTAYFDPFPTDLPGYLNEILVDSAEVTIQHFGNTYVLKNGFFFNPVTGKFFNYYLNEPVPADTDNSFILNILTPDGKHIGAETRILPVVPIDSVVVEFDEKKDSFARVLTYLTDDPTTENYYRRMLHHNSLDSIPEQDFTTFDDFVDDGVLVFGSAYDFEVGDTVFTTIFNIDRAFFDFWESGVNAIISNGNPFGQPSAIISNLTGDTDAIGIFTGLSYDRRMVIISK